MVITNPHIFLQRVMNISPYFLALNISKYNIKIQLKPNTNYFVSSVGLNRRDRWHITLVKIRKLEPVYESEPRMDIIGAFEAPSSRRLMHVECDMLWKTYTDDVRVQHCSVKCKWKALNHE